MKIITYIIGLFILIISCQNLNSDKLIDKGETIDGVYRNDDLKWKINIPEEWIIIDNDEDDNLEKKALKSIEETADRKFDVSAVVDLIGFKKDDFNSFLSTAEPYGFNSESEFIENNSIVKRTLYQTYLNKNIALDSTKTKKITINGVVFETYKFSVYDNFGSYLIHQEIFCGVVNGSYLFVNVNYNTDKNKNIIMNSWLNSLFE